MTWLSQQLPAMERDLARLVNLNSFTTHRAGGQQVVDALLEVFAVPGLVAERVSSAQYADHLVFRSQGNASRSPVALIGHLDTVFPPGVFEGYRVDQNLRRGPGVLDMKGGLVVMAWALKAVHRLVGLQAVPPLRIVIVSDEEVGSPEGAPLIAQVTPGVSAALVFESGRADDSIVTRRKGVGSCRCEATGVAAHAGNNYWQGANAIWSLARFVDAAQQLSNEQTGVTVNVGRIEGGTAKNTVPAHASAEIDLRFTSPSAMHDVMTNLNRVTREAQVAGTTLQLIQGPTRPPLERTAQSAQLLESYARCAQAHGLQVGEAPLQGGGSDANTTAALGIASIDGLGPRGRGFHTPDEYIEVDTLIPRAAALADWLMQRTT